MDPLQPKSPLPKASQWLKAKLVAAKTPEVKIQVNIIYFPAYPNTLLERMQAKTQFIQPDLQYYPKGSSQETEAISGSFSQSLPATSSVSQEGKQQEHLWSLVDEQRDVQGEQGNRPEF